MPTEAQIAANQANARLSTGPRTTEGKSRVSQNATRHGFASRYPVIGADERDTFNALHDALAEELKPQGALEAITFQELLHAAWNLQRLSRVESEISTGGAVDFLNPAVAAALDRVARYQSRAQRSYYKALAELRTLQTTREHLTKQTQTQPAVRPIKQTPGMFDREAAHHVQRPRLTRDRQPVIQPVTQPVTQPVIQPSSTS